MHMCEIRLAYYANWILHVRMIGAMTGEAHGNKIMARNVIIIYQSTNPNCISDAAAYFRCSF